MQYDRNRETVTEMNLFPLYIKAWCGKHEPTNSKFNNKVYLLIGQAFYVGSKCGNKFS
jgi:hypothetical protein